MNSKSRIVKIHLTITQSNSLDFIPESDLGYHNVWIYLQGPKPDKQQFRFKTLVIKQKEMHWPVSLGPPGDYIFLKFQKV